MNEEETIAALCTGVGGAVAIVRLSGTRALEIANKVWHSKNALSNEHAREMCFGFVGGETPSDSEPALGVYFPEPGSYTGEDVVEIHCHGGVIGLRRVLDSIFEAGAKPAAPGEFTRRAFINGKMDLTQAEAVADLIGAHSDSALHLAKRQMSGCLGNKIRETRSRLIDALAECESRMDFVEEHLDWRAIDAHLAMLDEVTNELAELMSSQNEGTVLREGVRVLIAGRPNVGKSSLLNSLLGFDRAIVTKIPGTTRDTLEEYASIRGVPVKLIDSAGIREADDEIERYGIERSLDSMKQAQIIFWLLDSSSKDLELEKEIMLEHVGERRNTIAVWNKIDLNSDIELPGLDFPSAHVSATENLGMNILMDHFESLVWEFPHSGEPEIAVSQRHAQLLANALDSLPGAAEQLKDENWELAAFHLRESVRALGEIIGESVDPDILENIFSRFCIGK